MSPFNLLMTRSTTLTEEEMMLFGTIGIIVWLSYLFAAIFAIIMFFVNAVPLYIMGKKAGFRHAWLAFIPFGQNYVAMTLPHREFNIFNWIKTTNRKKAFWAYVITWGIWLVSMVTNEIISWISPYLTEADFASMSGGGMIALLVGMLVLLVVSLINMLVSLVNVFAMFMIRWRMYYDLLLTYREPKNAMWVSIVSLFINIIMTVFSYMIMNKTPEYGFGNYYAKEIIPNKPQKGSGNSHAAVAGNNVPATQTNKIVAEDTVTEEKLPSSVLAITSFVCGILSLIGFGGIPSLVALICGFAGKGIYPTYVTEYRRCQQGITMALISWGISVVVGIFLAFIWMAYIFG